MARQLQALKSAIEILETIKNDGSYKVVDYLDRIEEIKAVYHSATDTAVITVHQHRQLRVEVINDEQYAYAARSFNAMIEARAWLSERGVRDGCITFRVEQVCDRLPDSSGYVGIYRCANCKDSCVA
jgi:hypothetical protein